MLAGEGQRRRVHDHRRIRSGPAWRRRALTGATIMQQGNVVMKVTRTGEDTVLSQIIALVARAQATKAPVQRLADRIARVFVPAVIIAALWTVPPFLLRFTVRICPAQSYRSEKRN